MTDRAETYAHRRGDSIWNPETNRTGKIRVVSPNTLTVAWDHFPGYDEILLPHQVWNSDANARDRIDEAELYASERFGF